MVLRHGYSALGKIAAKYVRLDFDPGPGLAPEPTLIVMNHGFGSLADLNVLVAGPILEKLGLGLDKPFVILSHEFAWTMGVGYLLEPAGFRKAGYDVALKALKEGVSVFVLPGGDLEATKPWTQRNKVMFNGRSGFARLAKEAGVPISPIVVTGAGDTLINFSDGQDLAHLIGLDKFAQQKTLPVSFALPWGFNVGLAMIGYLPWPAKMHARVCEPVTVGPNDNPATIARQVEKSMNDAAAAATNGRNPYLDWLVL